MLRLHVRELAGHPLRTAATLAMLALCTALAVAVAGLVQSVRSTSERLTEQVAGTADIEVASAFTGGTVRDDVVEDVARVDGVAAVAPTVQSAVAVDGERATLLAGDQRALTFLPGGLAESLDVDPTTAGSPEDDPATTSAAGPALETATVVVSASLADDLRLGPGDEVDVRGPYGVSQVRVGGVLPPDAASGSLLITDLMTGLELRGGDRGYDRALVSLDGPGRGSTEVSDDMRRALDGRAVLVDPDQRSRDASDAFRPLIQPLMLLAGLTVTVAGVLVFNVVSVSVAERRRQLAIQCALGGRRRRLWAGLVGEAALLGAVGGAAGAALGRRVTTALVDQVPPVLANHAFATRIAVDVPGWLLVAGAAVGLVAAATAAAVAGRPVVRLSPLEAMGPRDIVGEHTARPRLPVVVLGMGCIVAGIAAIALGPVAAQPVAALVVLDGVVVLVWALRAPLAQAVARIARSAGPPGLLASLAVARSPARNATTLLGALLPVTSVVAFGGLQQNVYDTARHDYASMGRPDLYVTAEPFSEVSGEVQLPSELADELAGLDGVDTVVRQRLGFARVRGGEVYVDGVEPGTDAPGVQMASPAARRALFDADGLDAIVTETFASRLGLRRGDTLMLPTSNGSQRVRVADVVELFGWPGGAMVVPYEQLVAWTGSDVPSVVAIHLDRPEAARAVADVVERNSRQSGLDLLVTRGHEAVDEGLLSVRQSQALLGALQVVLMVAGAFAIVSTLVISTLGRTRELGLLRAVGARRRLVRRAVVVESFVVTLTGAAMGVVVGTLFQFVGVRLAADAVGFPADFAVTLRPSLTALVAGLAIAGIAAVATLRRILRLDILDAVAYE